MDTLYVNMFGEFTLTYKENKITDQINRSKKIWSFLSYLITFKNRDVSLNELVELLWPDDDSVEDPANTLKTLVHRARTVLDNLGLEDTKKIITCKAGTYSFNDVVPYVVDTDVFENYYNEAYTPFCTESERLRNFIAATDLYHGDFLNKNSSDNWVVPLSTYYRTRYLKMIADACTILMNLADYEQVVTLCQKAVIIDPYEESLHYNLIYSLVKINKQQQALSHYNYVKNLFYSKFAINLSDDMVSLYKEVIKSSKSVESDITVIMDSLQEKSNNLGSFFCELEFFKDIYQLETRSVNRTGQVVHIALLSISTVSGRLPPIKVLNKTIEKLRDTIQGTLRRGDIFTRYSVSQYLIMLPMTTFENATMVTERIIKIFNKENPKAMVSVSFTLQAITVQ